MPFQKGKSGNPAGRPPKKRALAEVLRTVGNASIEGTDGKKVARKRVVAELLWEVATTGSARFPGYEKEIEAGPSGWLDVVKFIFGHVDGPARAEMDVDLSGNLQVDDNGLTNEERARKILGLIAAANVAGGGPAAQDGADLDATAGASNPGAAE